MTDQTNDNKPSAPADGAAATPRWKIPLWAGIAIAGLAVVDFFQVEARRNIIRDGVVDLDELWVAHTGQGHVDKGVGQHIVQQKLAHIEHVDLGQSARHQLLEYPAGERAHEDDAHALLVGPADDPLAVAIV